MYSLLTSYKRLQLRISEELYAKEHNETLFRSSSSALKLGQSAGLSPEDRVSFSSRENQEKGENCHPLFSSLVFIALVLHELVTTCNRYESRALQGRVTKRYKEESQCYKLVSLCVTRKFREVKRRRETESIVCYCL